MWGSEVGRARSHGDISPVGTLDRNVSVKHADPLLPGWLLGPCLMPSSPFLTVSLGFFEDILIPPESLQQPAKLYPSKVKWVIEKLRPLQ